MCRIYLAFFAVFLFLSGFCHAQDIFSEEHAAYLIDVTHRNFWGKAKLSNGEVVQPIDEHDRQTLPIPHAEAVRIVRAAAPAGLASWCGIDSQPYYLLFMKSERSKQWSDKQIAFIGMLFGVAQGNLKKTMEEAGPCMEKDREGVARVLAEKGSKL